MKRKLLLSLSLLLSAGALVPASATAALPIAATIKDARDDVSTVGTAEKGSHPLDIYKLTATKSGKNLAVTMTLDNLTRKNTGSFTVNRPDGSVFQSVRTSFTVGIKLDRATYDFAATIDNRVTAYRNRTSLAAFCGDPDRTAVKVDLVRDTVRMLIPLNCLDNPRVGKILGGSAVARTGSPQRGDVIPGPSVRFLLR